MDTTVPQRLYRIEKAQEDAGEALTRLERQVDMLQSALEDQQELVNILLHSLKERVQDTPAPEQERPGKSDGPIPGTMLSC